MSCVCVGVVVSSHVLAVVVVVLVEVVVVLVTFTDGISIKEKLLNLGKK